MRMDIQPTDLHADHGAQLRARALARAALAELTVPLGVLGIGLLVLLLDGHEVSWLAGGTAGGGAGAWVVPQRGSRPARRRGVRLTRRRARRAGAEPRAEHR